MQPKHRSASFLIFLSGFALAACGSSEENPTTNEATPAGSAEAPATDPAPARPVNPTAVPDDLPNGLLVTYSHFGRDDNGRFAVPQPARLEIITRSGGEWHVEVISDPESSVFHKAMYIAPAEGEPGILTGGGAVVTDGRGGGAHLKIWRRGDDGWSATTLWHERFSGTRSDRMRDIEVGDLFGDGRPAIAVATHDRGVFGVLRQRGAAWEISRYGRTEDAQIVHEAEIGDLNGDGVLEVYTTPSEPNRLVGGSQHGEVVSYIPSQGAASRRVVADLGERHAKEIWVGDVDGDGRDELYVAVEALTEGAERNIVEPVEIRRYDVDTPADGGVVVATIQDRQCRFLTVGDFDGDGKREMIAAALQSGLYQLQPGENPRAEWVIERIDRDSGGFEHTAMVLDLDDNDIDELYVSDDNQGELRRYVWVEGRPRRRVIHRRDHAREMMTWNIMPVPRAFVTP